MILASAHGPLHCLFLPPLHLMESFCEKHSEFLCLLDCVLLWKQRSYLPTLDSWIQLGIN